MTAFDECDRMADLIPEFLAGRVSEDDDQLVRRHLAECTECRKRANAVSLLQQTPVPVPDPDRWDYFVKGVVEETERRGRLALPRRVWGIAAVLVAVAAAIFLWMILAGVDRPNAAGIDAVAREVAELPDGEVAEWTTGLSPTEFMPAGFDASGLSEEEIEQLVTEVGRT